MKAREIVGKRVRAVQQTRASLGEGRDVSVYLDYIEFEDGTRLYFNVHEGDNEYGVVGVINKTAKARRSR